MIVLDTNIVVALLDKKDVHHKKVLKLLEELGDKKVYILNVNLAERCPKTGFFKPDLFI
jgi:predicted nucleic acid-binding protein